MIASLDVINLIAVPIYYLYPSKFIARMEKLLNACCRTENRAPKDKPTAIFLYCSEKLPMNLRYKYGPF